MFAWYKNQVADFGLLAATRLLVRVVWRRAIVVTSNKLFPADLMCPCCGWQGRRFLDYIEMGYAVPNAACPRCDSHSRHRALYVWLRDQYRFEQQAGIALLFAPEKALAPLWQTASRLQVLRIDVEPSRNVDLLGDIMHLPFANEVATLVWCHHVLEQVVDDRIALKELFRVLRTDAGELIISAGTSEQDATVEFGFSDKSLSGNRRRFGKDFAARLTEAGFQVTPMAYNLTADEYRKYGVYEEAFYRCIKSASEQAKSDLKDRP